MMIRCIEADGVLERNFLFTNTQLNVLRKRNIHLLRRDGFHFYDITYRTIDEIVDRVLTHKRIFTSAVHSTLGLPLRAVLAEYYSLSVQQVFRENYAIPHGTSAQTRSILTIFRIHCHSIMGAIDAWVGLHAPCDRGLLVFPAFSEAYLPWYGSENPRAP